MTVLHIANWYPNPWDNVEGNFVRDQIRVFSEVIPAKVIVVQVRYSRRWLPSYRRITLDGGAQGYFLLAPVQPGRVTELLSALLLVSALLRERAWRFNVLHFHIAYPLLMQSRLWRWWIRRPILVSEHWSAYHYNFHLQEGSRALRNMRKPFQRVRAVFAVSGALLSDIRAFAQTNVFKGFVIPNVVPLQKPQSCYNVRAVPVLFVVSRWVAVKNPLPMLEGLSRAAELGGSFRLVIGGYGPLIDDMMAFVEASALRERTSFMGKLSKAQIAEQLSQTDGYLFSSDYETFSVACAEALGAGVPLIGPYIPAIAEYAEPQDWVRVSERNVSGWCSAIKEFLFIQSSALWDKGSIAKRAADKFSESALRMRYRDAMRELGFEEQL